MNKKFYLWAIFLVIANFCWSQNYHSENNDFSLKVTFKEKNDTSIRFVQNTGIKQDLQLIKGEGKCEKPYEYMLKLKNTGNKRQEIIVKIEMISNQPNARFFLPGYMYGSNQGNTEYNPKLLKQFQRLRKGNIEFPYAPYWFANSNQLTHPVAVMFTNKTLFAISGSPYLTSKDNLESWRPGEKGFYQFNGFYCSIEKNASIGYTLGYLNAPGIYTRPHAIEKYSEKQQGAVCIEPGKTVCIPFQIYSFPAEKEIEFGSILENVYKRYHEKNEIENTKQNAAIDITNAISRDAFGEECLCYALISAPTPAIEYVSGKKSRFDINGMENVKYNYFNEGVISWTGGTVIATPLLQASYVLNNNELRLQALKVIQNIVDKYINPKNGIPFCHCINGVLTNKSWWKVWVESEGKQAEHSSYIVGQALYYILKAYQLESDKNVIHEDWLNYVKNILSVVSTSQNNAGAFPRFWSENDISGSEFDSFSGCWVAAAMAYYSKITTDTTFLNNAIQAETYYSLSVWSAECIKTPLDVADAPDSEGILAYIRLTKLLCEITGNEQYLKKMKAGIDYELSFKFCYNVPILAPPLNLMDWKTCGGTITSVCNAVIHCMSNNSLDEMYYYYQQTGDEYYKSRIKDAFSWGLQAYNQKDNEFFFGKKGWSTEYFCQADRYVLDNRLPDNTRSNIWFAYHPWATASILEGICGKLWWCKDF